MSAAVETAVDSQASTNGRKPEKQHRHDQSDNGKRKRKRDDDEDEAIRRNRKKAKEHSAHHASHDYALSEDDEHRGKSHRRKHKKGSRQLKDTSPPLLGRSPGSEADDGVEESRREKKKRKEKRRKHKDVVKAEEPHLDAQIQAKPKKHRKKDKHSKTINIEDPERTPSPPKREHDTAREGEIINHESEDADVHEDIAQDEVETRKKRQKKHKRDRRDREASDAEKEAGEDLMSGHAAAEDSSKKTKKVRSKVKLGPGQGVENEDLALSSGSEVEDRRHKKDRKEKKKKRKHKTSPEPSTRKDNIAVVDARNMDATEPDASIKPTADLPSDSSFPFYTQTVSLYVPFYPIGFDKPITNVTAQHLEPMMNHYSPTLGGVPLSYRNVNLSEQPRRPDPNNLPNDQTAATLISVDEYAVGFGWLTADIDLFIPGRGAEMEGKVNLQSEGHIGVVCWGKFNASIEAKRLPPGWRWVDLTAPKPSKHNSKRAKRETSNGAAAVEGELEEENGLIDFEDSLLTKQIHMTGYWVDSQGKTPSSVRFRIKNFDVGLSGDYGYLSIEGTMLDEDAERALATSERAIERGQKLKQNPTGILRPMSRAVPEFSMTRLGRKDEAEDEDRERGAKIELYKGSRPVTPDD